jgi:hypothetical protein
VPHVLRAEAEAAYNLGRAAHRIGLLHVAVAHYERVLQLADESDAAAAADGAAQQLQGLSVEQPSQPSQQQQQGADDMQVGIRLLICAVFVILCVPTMGSESQELS